MNTRYIEVVTNGTRREIEAYLYSTAKIVGEGTIDGRRAFVVKVSTDRPDVQYLAQYQADRLSSGLHGAKVLDTREQARL